MNEIIFVGGVGRSGTSAFCEFLSKLPSFGKLDFETRFNVDPGGVFDTYRTLKNRPTPFKIGYEIKRLEKFLLNFNSKSKSKSIYKDWGTQISYTRI